MTQKALSIVNCGSSILGCRSWGIHAASLGKDCGFCRRGHNPTLLKLLKKKSHNQLSSLILQESLVDRKPIPWSQSKTACRIEWAVTDNPVSETKRFVFLNKEILPLSPEVLGGNLRISNWQIHLCCCSFGVRLSGRNRRRASGELPLPSGCVPEDEPHFVSWKVG